MGWQINWNYTTSDSSEKELSLFKKITSVYKTKSVIISDEYEDYNSDILVKYKKGESKIANILNKIIIVQLLAFKTAIKLRRNVDKPIGLNKVVGEKG